METIKKMFRPLIQSHTMNHINYKVFNSIQDPAAKKIDEQYSFLQGKVADSVIFIHFFLHLCRNESINVFKLNVFFSPDFEQHHYQHQKTQVQISNFIFLS